MVLSVITPLYKLSKGSNLDYLQELLQSLARAFTFSVLKPGEYELIFINDCPEENYEEKITAWCNTLQIAGIRFLRNEKNIGQAASRNIGAHHAHGKFLHFIDQDDYINESFYKSLLQLSTDVRLAVVYIVKEGNSPQLYTGKRYINRIQKSRNIKDLYLLHLDSIAVSPGQYIVSNSIFKQVGGFPVLSTRGADDYGFLYLLMGQSVCTISIAETASFYYRFHSNQNRNTSSLDVSVDEFFGGYPATNSLQDKTVRLLKLKLPFVNRICRKLVNLHFFNRIA